MIKSSYIYDRVKFTAQIVLPALATLYFALSQVWGFAYGPEVVASITAFDTFLGLVLGYSTVQYKKSDAKYDGSLDILETEDTRTFSLELDDDPEYLLEGKDEVVFKVNKHR